MRFAIAPAWMLSPRIGWRRYLGGRGRRAGSGRDVGFDLVVEGCAKPGHEAEQRRMLERSFAGEQLSTDEIVRFREISIPGYQRVGAPPAGFDSAADAWIIEARGAKTPDDAAAALGESHGDYVLRLVGCVYPPGRTAAYTMALMRRVCGAPFSKTARTC